MTSYDLTARRRYSREEKAAIVAEAVREGSVSGVARRHRIAAALLFRWKRDLAAAAAAPAETATRATRFVPATIGQIDLPEAEKKTAPRRPCASPIGDPIEIAFPSGAVLKAPAGIGETALARLIKLLNA